MDSDRILVMDAGSIAEFDEPHLLLQREDSIFRAIVKQTGPATTTLPKNMALQAFLKKRRTTALTEEQDEYEEIENAECKLTTCDSPLSNGGLVV